MMATATASEIAAYVSGGVLLCIMCEFAFIIDVEWWRALFQSWRNKREKREKLDPVVYAARLHERRFYK